MKIFKAATGFALALAATTLPAANSVAQTQAQAQPQPPSTWRGCCGVTAWSHGPGMMGGGPTHGGGGPGMMGGSMSRHRMAMMGGVPAPYTNLSNPLPQTAATIERGAAVYATNCASCHGATGLGDGEAARTLNPRPANLAWLSNMQMVRWDPFMYWAIAEGGAQFDTGMPAFKGSLSKDEIWAVTAFIQAHIPQMKATR